MRKKYVLMVHLTLLFLMSLTALAGSRTTFGPEWEFTTEELRKEWNTYNNGSGVHWQTYQNASSDAKKTAIRSIQESARGKLTGDGFGEFTYENQFSFKVTSDPAVIEVTATGSTVDQFLAMAPRLQRDLFDVMNAKGFETRREWNGGHIHIGLASSGMLADPMLFRNFVVDFFNHSEIASGVLDYDSFNAPPVSEATAATREAIESVIREFDQLPAELKDTNKLKNDLRDAYLSRSKYQALNFNHEETIEIRSIHGQKDMYEFILLIQLWDARIEYLRKLKQPIELHIPKPMEDGDEMIQRFRRYVEDAGLSWKRFSVLLPEDWGFGYKRKGKAKLTGCESLFYW